MNNLKRKLLYLFLSISDSIIWFFLYLSSSRIALSILKNKFWRHLKIKLTEEQNVFIKTKLKNSAVKLMHKNIFSSCLSRSVLFMIIFDIFGINTKLYLGMLKNKNQKKIAHAWLKIDQTKEFITPNYKKCSLLIEI